MRKQSGVLRQEGRRTVSLSIDDLYLTHEAQKAVSEQFQDNPLLQGRGNAGTHDVPLGVRTLRQLVHWEDGVPVKVPRYNKSAFGGQGDRHPEESWPVVRDAPDVVLLEGWCLGFRPVDPRTVADPHLRVVNSGLEEHFRSWCSVLDAFIVIQIADPRWVYTWRLQAEHQMIAQGNAGMSDEAVARFCDRYMPSYAQYLPGLYATKVVAGRQLTVRVDQDRRPVC